MTDPTEGKNLPGPNIDWQYRAREAERQLAEAVEVVKPFATVEPIHYDIEHETRPDDHATLWESGEAAELTYSDLRRARTWLQKQEAGTNVALARDPKRDLTP